jgi:hypothetical protein
LSRVYPSIPPDTERRLLAIKTVAVGDPGYFSDAACPYPWLAEYVIGGAAASGRIELFNDEQTGAEASETVLGEVEATIEEMKGMENELVKAEVSDRIAFFRAKTAMLERWTNLKEKLINMKAMSDFQKVVVQTMEEVLDKDQQQEFKNKLKGLMV